MVGEKRNSKIPLNLPVTDVPRCTSSNSKTLGLKHLQLPGVASCSGPPDGASLVHHGPDELPVEQNTVPYGEAAPPVQERTQHPQPLGGYLPYLIDVRRKGQALIKGHTQIAGCIDSYDWFPLQ